MKRFVFALLVVLVAVPQVALADEPAQTSPNSPAPATTPEATTTTTSTTAAPTTGSSPAVTENKSVVARTPEQLAAQSGFQLAFSLDHWLGTGTFVDPKLYSYLATNFTFAPQYMFNVRGVKLVATALARVTYEYTLPDVENGRRTTFYDTRFGLSAPALVRSKATGIGLTPSVGVTVPTSPESFSAGLIAAPSVGLAASRTFETGVIGAFDLRATLSGSRTFSTSTVNAVRPSDPTARDSTGALLVVCRSGETACGYAGMNAAWGFSGGASVNWRPNPELTFYAGYTYIRSWREAATTTVDQYTPKAVDSTGKSVARVGYGQFDRTFALLGGSYNLNEHYSVDVSVSTVQTPLTATGVVRFPLFGFANPADNTTSVNFTLSAAY